MMFTVKGKMHYSYVSTKWAEVLVGEMAAKTKTFIAEKRESMVGDA